MYCRWLKSLWNSRKVACMDWKMSPEGPLRPRSIRLNITPSCCRWAQEVAWSVCAALNKHPRQNTWTTSDLHHRIFIHFSRLSNAAAVQFEGLSLCRRLIVHYDSYAKAREAEWLLNGIILGVWMFLCGKPLIFSACSRAFTPLRLTRAQKGLFFSADPLQLQMSLLGNSPAAIPVRGKNVCVDL